MIEDLLKTLEPYMKSFIGFDINEWENPTTNIILTDNNKDFSLFERYDNSVFNSHIFCRDRKGKDAIKFGKWSVNKMFNHYGAEVLRGLTPLSNRPALLVARKIGFKPYGICETINGDMQVFILTKQDWNNQYE